MECAWFVNMIGHLTTAKVSCIMGLPSFLSVSVLLRGAYQEAIMGLDLVTIISTALILVCAAERLT